MGLKDLIRILRRRILSFLIVAIASLGVFWTFTDLKPPYYTARAKVLLAIPEAISMASPRALLQSPDNMTIGTWVDLVKERGVRETVDRYLMRNYILPPKPGLVETEEEKKKRVVPPETVAKIEKLLSPLSTEEIEQIRKGREGWLYRMRPVAVERTQLIAITAEGPTEKIAQTLANLFAYAAQEYSKGIANIDFQLAWRYAESEVEIHDKEIRRLYKVLQERKAKFNHQDIPTEAERLAGKYRETLTQIFDVDRQIKDKETQLARLQENRRLLATSSGTPVPRSDREVEALAANDPRVKSLEVAIDGLRRSLQEAERKYTPLHPEYQRLHANLLDLEVEMTNVRYEAAGISLDQEELLLRKELLQLRDRQGSLPKERDRLYVEIEKISEPLLEWTKLQEDLKKEREILASLNNYKSRFDLSRELNGYIKALDDQLAFQAEMTQPRNQQFWFIAAIVALLAGALFTYLLEQLDTRIRTDYDIRRHLNLPILSSIPRVRFEDAVLTTASRESFLGESFDTLATMISTTAGDRPIRTLLITSTNPGEGKTTVSINLAVAAARQGRRVLLIDSDMRIPAVHTVLHLPNEIGFSNLLSGQLTEQEAERLYHEPPVDNLRVICAGPFAENPYSLLDPLRVRPILEQLQEHFDLVIIDTPPLLRTGDAVKLASLTDGVLLVVGAYETDQRQATWAKRLLENVSARILGVLLNKTQESAEQYYYYSHYGSKSSSARES